MTPTDPRPREATARARRRSSTSFGVLAVALALWLGLGAPDVSPVAPPPAGEQAGGGADPVRGDDGDRDGDGRRAGPR